MLSSSGSLRAARDRYFEIMRRHVEADDIHLPDDELVKIAHERYLRTRRAPLIDPNE